MTRERRDLLGAFAAMLFVGASWGANLPVTKVMLGHFDLLPLATIRTATAAATLAVLLLLLEGARALRVELGLKRFLLLGLIMASFFGFYSLGIYFSNPITAATIQVASPLVSAATVRCVTGARFDPGFGVALGLTLLGGAILSASGLVGRRLRRRSAAARRSCWLSNALWTLYSIKAQVWFERASQLQRAYVASLSASGWLAAGQRRADRAGLARSPFAVDRRLGLDAASRGRGPGQRRRRLLLEHRRQPARRGRRVAVGQPRAVFRRIVVHGVWLRPQRLPDRRRPRGPERRGVHAVAQASNAVEIA